MPNVFLVSDLHLGHKRCAEGFMREDNCEKLRPFATVEEMDEALVANWNSVVKPGDKTYNLGDVFINRKAQTTLRRLNGKQVLIKGNHDIFSLDNYLPYFYDIRAIHKLSNFVLSHIPIHAGSLGRFKANVHGHLHEHRVMVLNEQGFPPVEDPRYFSVCVEQINYTPIELSVVEAALRERLS